MTSLTPEQRAREVLMQFQGCTCALASRSDLGEGWACAWCLHGKEVTAALIEAERAARRKAMEECAEICDAVEAQNILALLNDGPIGPQVEWESAGIVSCAQHLAAAIRSRMAQEEDAEAGEPRK